MITIELAEKKHTVIARDDILGLFDRFFRCFDKQKIKDLIQRYGSSNAAGRSLPSFDSSRRIVTGIAAACLIHDRIKPPGDFLTSNESWFLIKFLTELHEKATADEQKKLWGTLRQILDKNRDARQNFFELAIGFIYADFGATVTFTDIGDEARFEFLVEKGGYRMEVEVKTLSSLSGHPLPAATADSFAAAAHTMLDELEFPFAESHVRIVIKGKHAKHLGLLVDLKTCIEYLKKGKLASGHGNVVLSVSRALPGDLESIKVHGFSAQYLLPDHLRQYPLYSLLSPKTGKAFSTISFTEPWNIGTNLDRHLKDAYAKFTRKLPAVVWVCLSDASSFMTNPHARSIGFFRNDKVRRIINKYQAPDRYEYPTGFVIASSFSFKATEGENSQLSLHGRYRFYRNKGLATEHFRFSPYHEGPF